MVYIEPLGPTYRMEETPGGLTMTVPIKRDWFAILFVGFWLVGWAVGEVAVVSILGVMVFLLILQGGDAWQQRGFSAFVVVFLLAWLGGWTAGGIWTIKWFIRSLESAEIITFSHTSLLLARKILWWRRQAEFNMREVASLRLERIPIPSEQNVENRGNGITGPVALVFDYGARTVWFGEGLDEPEARRVFEEVATRFPDKVALTEAP